MIMAYQRVRYTRKLYKLCWVGYSQYGYLAQKKEEEGSFHSKTNK